MKDLQYVRKPANRDVYQVFSCVSVISILTTGFLAQPAGVRRVEQRVCSYDAGHGERPTDIH
jgi:hypothetical protein